MIGVALAFASLLTDRKVASVMGLISGMSSIEPAAIEQTLDPVGRLGLLKDEIGQ